jgi:uncharacterized damage-inducible protein DinB
MGGGDALRRPSKNWEELMEETDRIAEIIGQAADGDALHGPALQDAVNGVSGEDAALRAVPGAHTIWEIVLHMTVWATEVERRLRERARPLDAAEDWPAPVSFEEGGWGEAKSALIDAHRRLRQTIREFPAGRLPEAVPGKVEESANSFYIMLHGLAQHDAYHAGQIAMLKKAIAARTATAV